jgi:hypothetical protein
MADTPTIHWPGQSGRTYLYYIHPIGTKMQAIGGNYIFAKTNAQGYWVPVYIGQTGNLDLRFDDHHKAGCVKRHAATHIHVHGSANERDRLAEETDLVRKWSPLCNG